jgi:hypothetical protein
MLDHTNSYNEDIISEVTVIVVQILKYQISDSREFCIHLSSHTTFQSETVQTYGITRITWEWLVK